MESGKAPVAYLVFNRPRHTRTTFAAIRAYRPSQLFVVADGPRPGRPDDAERCAEVRRIVAEVDWPCDVQRDYSDVNLGCARRVSSGLDRVFSQAESAIVLEDDCLASADFFLFCEALLARYRDDPRVWVVNGNSYQPQFRRGDGTYYFSRFPDTWGWASWRRAWRNYSHNLPFLDEWLGSPYWSRQFPSTTESRYFRETFRETLDGVIDSWAWRWTACVIHGHGLCATPNANLVQNIGFDADATHTHGTRLAYEHTSLGALEHPRAVGADIEADAFYARHFGFGRGVLRSFARRVRLRVEGKRGSP